MGGTNAKKDLRIIHYVAAYLSRNFMSINRFRSIVFTDIIAGNGSLKKL